MSETGRVLKPANENPWYVLMTLYGEQDGEEVDWELHEKNRAAWNAWAGQGMTEEEIRNLAACSRVGLDELRGWERLKDEIIQLHCNVMKERNSRFFAYDKLPSVDQSLEFSETDFTKTLCCKQFIFAEEVTFRFATFNKDSVFNTAMFCGYCSFENASFIGESVFKAARFSRLTTFEHAKFNGIARFGDARFISEVSFQHVIFCELVRFTNAMFCATTWFINSKFNRLAWFRSATFNDVVWFSSVQFTENAILEGATFNGNALFRSAQFFGDAVFGRATFNADASFLSAVFSGSSYFNETKFNIGMKHGQAIFSYCQFLKSASFRDAKFATVYPDFNGAMLHDKTTFTAISDYWPKVGKNDPEQAKASCAVIRHNLGKQGLPEEEHFFFRREMGFAAQIGGWWQRLPYRVFGAVSDFGYSIQRPALWLFGLWLAVAMINHVVLQWAASRQGTDYHVVQAFGLSFANQFPVFGLQGRWFSAEFLRDLNPWLKALGGVQTVLSLPLLFFFALGLRTRFRMR